ncbi:MAG: GNAT family N-acetyltransferase [Phenylobacterium sp.]
MIRTERLVLRPWRDADLDAMAAMHRDVEVMADAGGVQDGTQAEARITRYQAAIDRLGYGRWAVEDHAGAWLGYVGVMPIAPDHPLAPGDEAGWRLVRSAWGQGYASEGARAAIAHALDTIGLAEVVAYTAPDNHRSQAVMCRLGLERRPDRDFTFRGFRGLVWCARRGSWRAPATIAGAPR